MDSLEYTVLIVEDRADLVNLWVREFKFREKRHKVARFKVHSASSFAEAKEKCLSGVKPNLAIVDHNLHDVDKTGHNVCLFLLEKFPEIDIVVNTGYSTTNINEISGSTAANPSNLKVYQLYCGLQEQYPDNIRFTEKYEIGKQTIEYLRPIITKLINRDSVMWELRNFVLSRSKDMERCLRSLASHADDPILLLTGEAGAGKSYIAKALHKARLKLKMPSGPFITVESPAEKHILKQSLREGAIVLLKNISRFSEDQWRSLTEAIELFARKTSNSEEGSSMLVLTDIKAPLNCSCRDTIQTSVYEALAHCSISIPDLKDRPEDVLVLAGTFVSRFNANHGTGYFLSSSAEHHLKSERFSGSVGDLKKTVDGVMQIARREGSSQISALHFTEAWKKLASNPLNISPETPLSPPVRFDRDDSLSHRIQNLMDAIKTIKANLPAGERVTNKMADDYRGNNSGGKATANFMNRHHKEIAAFIEDNLSEYQNVVPDIKQMCRKVADELLRKGI